MRVFLWLCLCLILPSYSLAQQLSLTGRILDEHTKAAVPFASIGIRSTALGTVADALGHFRFSIPAKNSSDSLLISCVGYQMRAVPVSAFLGHSPDIRLVPVGVQLAAVTVRPGKVKTKMFGRTGSSTLMGANLYTEPNLVDDGLAKEQGTILSIDPECLLQDFNFHVAFNRFKSVRFRLNIYSVKGGLPDHSLLTQDIQVEVTQPRGWVKVDLRPYHIYLEGHKEIAVTLQWLQSEAIEGQQKAFGVSAVPMPGHQVLSRNKSQDQWRVLPSSNLSFYLTADSYRSTGHSEPKSATSAESLLPDSLRYLRYLAAQVPTLSNPQRYGNNPAVGHYVAVKGARLYYERYGHGEPLLLLHGNGQSIAAFQEQIGELAKHFDVIAVDTRAQGKSQDQTTTDFTYDLFAEDMRQLLDSLHLRHVHVLGWSDGGNTALKLALKYPAYVNRLAIMGANLFPTPQAIEPDFLALLRKQLQHESVANPPDTNRLRLLRLLLQEPQMSFQELRNLAAPTLVMAGQHDLVLEPHTRALAKALPNGQLAIFSGATHYAPQEVPTDFNKAVLQFLRKP
ncbi:Pimeloyl-ACP methyl ester carboxylesterase [Hymenobacter gelipurpurascens]|uniref:Pimeloyl-ACP methyl ester carboxylesterase n=1 Tax=Hymenobacter gelipurpurascens TaxID=89968 RepID=A0A212TB13_9BACT|nr:alpha/beta fold hydrolase [Hymenobacter gelipurpurascens]SNC63233.1 Pimeloyl-ACP methyl ester carboxylesterase [Hymenobacter gelipurpurascens]